jgi:hypothetical protein
MYERQASSENDNELRKSAADRFLYYVAFDEMKNYQIR